MTGGLVRRLQRFDSTVDGALERLRGHRSTDLLFNGASHAADFSVLWIVIGAVYGLAVERNGWSALWFAAFIGAESLVVNQGIKRLFRRVRPTERGDARYKVRKPRSSSFPSGHASSAFYAGTILSAWVGWWSVPVWLVLALIVATSRAYVRIHHPSDVVAGIATGLVLGGIVLFTPAIDVLRG